MRKLSVFPSEPGGGVAHRALWEFQYSGEKRVGDPLRVKHVMEVNVVAVQKCGGPPDTPAALAEYSASTSGAAFVFLACFLAFAR
jgi:hypothetical protein